ncbi:GH25 family lysozyme [Bacillus paramycoides]|uniref:GH25 family lysozyme n=1 Tax=Bacillus paramycoides TaxID=2026194 RepID=UPI002E24252B|nr:GH25 family lysozyme [Bacillus paramycoides]MED1115061.1 GH25 family lysozyme [Bacillus paramycoides]
MSEKRIVDISKWNDRINWPVAAPEIELEICRVQYGSNLVDYLYNEHVVKLEQYGIQHAAYAYGCFVSEADAIVEAKDFIARVSPNAKFLVLDVEDDTVKSMKSKGNLNDLAKASQAFIDTCKAAGWKVGFYVAHHMYGDYNLQSVQADFVWLPRYGTNDGNPQVKPSYPCDIGKQAVRIQTGGFSNQESIAQITQYILDKKWWVELTFDGKGNVSYTTGGLYDPEVTEFEKWMKERGWWCTRV